MLHEILTTALIEELPEIHEVSLCYVCLNAYYIYIGISELHILEVLYLFSGEGNMNRTFLVENKTGRQGFFFIAIVNLCCC